MSGNALEVRIEGPAPVMSIAVDLARRSLWLVPVAVIIGFLFWGAPGAASTLYALAIVVVNFLASAYLLAATGRINATLMAGAAMFGFLGRLAVVVAAVMLVKDQPWVELVPLGITLIVAHLALLFWEMRYISGSLAFPGVKPAPTPNPYLPGGDTPSASGSIPSAASSDAHTSPNAQ